MNDCPFIKVSFGIRTLYCNRLEGFKQQALNDAKKGCPPRVLNWYNKAMADLERAKRKARPTPKKATIEPYLLREIPTSQLN